MAGVNANHVQEAVEGFHALPIMKQIGLLVGLSASVALGVWVVLWAQQPELSPLYTDLPAQELTEILDNLNQTGIKSKADPESGTLWVPADKLSDLRLQMAAKGLPRSSRLGFETLTQDHGFGASKFVENIRFKQAMEHELARTIASIASVRKARVHLALPKASVFVRDQRKPSASVFVDLYAGRVLEKGQVHAIANMVASGVPDLTPHAVTVIDQRGRLLTDWGEDENLRVSHQQLEYTRAWEREYVRRIEEILTPVLGDAKVRAQVTVDMDFTVTEKTQELFAPHKQPVVRSEQTQQELQSGAAARGVPGALSNQPPVGGTVASANTAAKSDTGGENSIYAGNEDPQKNSRVLQTRNYEIDKTIAYVKQHVGTVKRISVAVVVDDLEVKDKNNTTKRVPLQPQQMTRITDLVREAVGFSKDRGDTVTVVNTSFIDIDVEGGGIPEIPIWQRPIFWQAVKQGVAGIFILVVLFTVLKPLLTTLASKTITVRNVDAGGAAPTMLNELPDLPILKKEEMPKLPEPSASYGAKMDTIRNMVKDDPGRVAQVVLNWIGDDDE